METSARIGASKTPEVQVPGMRAVLLCMVAAVSAAAVIPPGVRAEVLPERGTFDGIYHRDRWGVATVGFLRLPPPFHERMAPYEGRHVRVELRKGHQVGDGVIVEDLGDVAALPAAPVSVSLRLVPPEPAAGEPFQAVCTITNRSTAPISWNVRSPDEVRMAWAVESSAGSPTVPAVLRKERTSLGQFATNVFGVGPIELAPGGSFAFPVDFETGLPAGKCEMTALAGRFPTDARAEWAFAVLCLDVGGTPRERSAPALRGSKTVVTPRGEGEFEVHLRVSTGRDDLLSLAWDGSPSSFAGRVRGSAEDGSPVPVEVIRDPRPDSQWTLAPLSSEGREVRFRVRHATRFPEKALDCLTVEVLGSEGLMPVEPPVAVRESPEPEQIPFGSATQDVRLRGRPAVRILDRSGEWRFHFQARNEGGKPIVWWQPHPAQYTSESVMLEVDGETVPPSMGKAEFIAGWPGARSCTDPMEWTARFPAPRYLAPGEHVLRLCIRSAGGTYRNANGQDVPVLVGVLWSNEIPFQVR